MMGRCSAIAIVLAAAAPASAAAKCGVPCNDGVHICDPTAECNLCMPSPAGQNKTYACGAGCGGACTADAHCGSEGCGKCANGTCFAPPAPTPKSVVSKCGGPCGDAVHVCDTASACNTCIPVTGTNATKFFCGAKCSGTCATDAQCGNALCGKCVNGTCAPQPAPTPKPLVSKCSGPCGDAMHVCDTASVCNTCIPVAGTNATKFFCGAKCNATCATDAQCGNTLCGKCVNGTCAQQPAPTPKPLVSKCGGACSDGKHVCDTSSVCNLCVPVHPNATKFVCGAGCNTTCTADAQCTTAGCGTCVNGTCVTTNANTTA